MKSIAIGIGQSIDILKYRWYLYRKNVSTSIGYRDRWYFWYRYIAIQNHQ